MRNLQHHTQPPFPWWWYPSSLPLTNYYSPWNKAFNDPTTHWVPDNLEYRPPILVGNLGYLGLPFHVLKLGCFWRRNLPFNNSGLDRMGTRHWSLWQRGGKLGGSAWWHDTFCVETYNIQCTSFNMLLVKSPDLYWIHIWTESWSRVWVGHVDLWLEEEVDCDSMKHRTKFSWMSVGYFDCYVSAPWANKQTFQ